MIEHTATTEEQTVSLPMVEVDLELPAIQTEPKPKELAEINASIPQRKTYIGHNKMRDALKKLDQTSLHDIPTMITITKITKARTDESKRRLVRTALYANTELHRRYPMPYSEFPYIPMAVKPITSVLASLPGKLANLFGRKKESQ